MKASAMPAPQVPWALVAWQRRVWGGARKREEVWWVTWRVWLVVVADLVLVWVVDLDGGVVGLASSEGVVFA